MDASAKKGSLSHNIMHKKEIHAFIQSLLLREKDTMRQNKTVLLFCAGEHSFLTPCDLFLWAKLDTLLSLVVCTFKAYFQEGTSSPFWYPWLPKLLRRRKYYKMVRTCQIFSRSGSDMFPRTTTIIDVLQGWAPTCLHLS